MSIYASSAIGTDTNKITFNGTTFPIFRVQARRPQQRNIRDLDINVPFENGISDFETLIGKTAYIIEGTMYPGSESNYDAGLKALRKLASLDISQADVLSDDGYVPYVYEEYSRSKQIFMKVLYVDIPESTRKGLVQPFKLVCKVKDPTIFGYPMRTANTGVADFTTATGTALYSFQYPIIYGASTTTVTVDANNIGDIPAYPVAINVYGPVNTPRITNVTTGEYIEVTVNLATSSNNLSIAYDKDSLIVTLDGVNVIKQVTNTSTYLKIQPGSNIFQLSGSSIGSNSYAVITYYDAYSLG
jgi:hypothetical protein